MTYEQANAWFKTWHEAYHQQIGVPMKPSICLDMQCGKRWQYILRIYPEREAEVSDE